MLLAGLCAANGLCAGVLCLQLQQRVYTTQSIVHTYTHCVKHNTSSRGLPLPRFIVHLLQRPAWPSMCCVIRTQASQPGPSLFLHSAHVLVPLLQQKHCAAATASSLPSTRGGTSSKRLPPRLYGAVGWMGYVCVLYDVCFLHARWLLYGNSTRGRLSRHSRRLLE